MAVQFGVYCPHRYSPGVGPLRKSVWQLFSDALFFGRLEATSDDDGAGSEGGDIAAGDDQRAAAVAAPLRMAHGPQPAAPGLHIAAVQDQITASFAVFAAVFITGLPSPSATLLRLSEFQNRCRTQKGSFGSSGRSESARAIDTRINIPRSAAASRRHPRGPATTANPYTPCPPPMRRRLPRANGNR